MRYELGDCPVHGRSPIARGRCLNCDDDARNARASMQTEPDPAEVNDTDPHELAPESA